MSDLPWLDPQLDRLLAAGERRAHALLICGRPGIGKVQMAEQFAAALLCEDRAPGGRACGRCIACGWFAQRTHPDLRIVTLAEEAAEKPDKAEGGKARKRSLEIRIDQIRALSDFLSVGGHRGGQRVVLLHPADAMNAIAANALLKTLEEPQSTVQFLLVSGRPQGLPATILSRCQRVMVSGPDTATALSWLQQHGAATPADAAEWLAASGDAPLLAAEFARSDRAAVHRTIVETLARLPDTSVLTATDALASLAASSWLSVLQAWLGDLGRASAGGSPRRFPTHEKRLRELARRAGAARLAGFSQWLDQQAQLAAHPMNARLFCEQTLLRYSGIFGPT